MQLVIKIILFKSPFTVCYIFEEDLILPDEVSYKSLGLNSENYCGIDIDDDLHIVQLMGQRSYRMVANAYFLQVFVKACLNSAVYRVNVLQNLYCRKNIEENKTVMLKLILQPPDQEIIDYAWNDRIQQLVWTRIEIENAFSWLSTLGGAYSALGDYFDYCAEEAGKISTRQYRLSLMLGDASLAARCKLYSSLSFAQKGKLKLARHVVRQVANFAVESKDTRLIRMCQGVWAKLKYLREIKRIERVNNKDGGDHHLGYWDKHNGEVVTVK